MCILYLHLNKNSCSVAIGKPDQPGQIHQHIFRLLVNSWTINMSVDAWKFHTYFHMLPESITFHPFRLGDDGDAHVCVCVLFSDYAMICAEIDSILVWIDCAHTHTDKRTHTQKSNCFLLAANNIFFSLSVFLSFFLWFFFLLRCHLILSLRSLGTSKVIVVIRRRRWRRRRRRQRYYCCCRSSSTSPFIRSFVSTPRCILSVTLIRFCVFIPFLLYYCCCYCFYCVLSVVGCCIVIWHFILYVCTLFIFDTTRCVFVYILVVFRPCVCVCVRALTSCHLFEFFLSNSIPWTVPLA